MCPIDGRRSLRISPEKMCGKIFGKIRPYYVETLVPLYEKRIFLLLSTLDGICIIKIRWCQFRGPFANTQTLIYETSFSTTIDHKLNSMDMNVLFIWFVKYEKKPMHEKLFYVSTNRHIKLYIENFSLWNFIQFSYNKLKILFV